ASTYNRFSSFGKSYDTMDLPAKFSTRTLVTWAGCSPLSMKGICFTSSHCIKVIARTARIEARMYLFISLIFLNLRNNILHLLPSGILYQFGISQQFAFINGPQIITGAVPLIIEQCFPVITGCLRLPNVP